jgi:hypothetical protein
LEDGTVWPNPDDPHDVAWRLRYAPSSLTKADRLLAASAMEAYARLIEQPTRARILTVRQIKAEVDRLREAALEALLERIRDGKD